MCLAIILFFPKLNLGQIREPYIYNGNEDLLKKSKYQLIFSKNIDTLNLLIERGHLIKRLSPESAIIDISLDTFNNLSVQHFPANNLFKVSSNVISQLRNNKNKFFEIQIFRTIGGNKMLDHQIVTYDSLLNIINDSSVEFIENFRRAHQETLINDLEPSANGVSTAHNYFPNISGLKSIISIKEDKFDAQDLDIIGRAFYSTTASKSFSDHATFMATLIAGGGITFIKGKGVAPKATLYSTNFNNLDPDSTSQLNREGILIQNHSYGVGIENYYGIEAMEYDKQVYESDTILHIFSSGNQGDSIPNDGMYFGVGKVSNLTGNFKQAKNVIVVGATDYSYNIESPSSRGPSYDGRIVPELVACGVDGTSNSASITTGICALMTQVYRTKYHKAPQSSLLKSILISSAEDLPPAHVDFVSGYGSVNAYEALKVISNEQYIEKSISNNQLLSYDIIIPGNCKEFKITLVWNDPPAEVNAPKALVNDLDLYVVDQSNKIVRPWTLNAFPNSDSLSAIATRGVDSLNNIEQVTIDNPIQGPLRIFIFARRTLGIQNFSLSWQFKENIDFAWDYPLNKDQLISGEYNYLRWESTGSGVGILDYSIDSGSTWNLITDRLDLSKGFYIWKTPELNNLVLLRCTNNDVSFVSPPFTISKIPEFNILYNCNSGSLFSWPASGLANNYTIYKFTGDSLQSYTSTADTFLFVSKDNMDAKYWTISQELRSLYGLKAPIVNIYDQGVDCYIKTFTADYYPKKEVLLSLNLSSIQNLKDILWEKLESDGNFAKIGSTNLENQNNYYFHDLSAKQGIQYYRVIIRTLDNKTQIISDTISAVISIPGVYQIFPNPTAGNLTLITGSSNQYKIEIHDFQGRTVFETKFNSVLGNFDISFLPSSIYYYKIFCANLEVKIGKIVKL
jgi:hypothetical protein